MGGRNISTTKSGKFMNPTDQARKEARKKELKKNKKQRLLVRQNVLKNKNPRSLISEMEHLDRMEYDPVNPAPYNIKVLQEKRKKVKETWEQVYRLYTKEQPELATQMDTLMAEYEKSRAQTITWFESVKETQRVTVDEIPMPELPSQSSTDLVEGPRGILKQRDSMDHPQRIVITRKPPGPPPGRPPILSDNEDISDDDEEVTKPTVTTTTDRRRIRFADPSSSTTVSRWSDPVPTPPFEETEFGTPAAAAQPVLYNTERPVAVMPPPPAFAPPPPPPARGMRMPPPPPPPAFFAANPNVRMPPNVRPAAVPKPVRPATSNVLSAPPSIVAKPTAPPAKPSVTFEAKPQIRARQDITKFVPTVLKVKRNGTNTKPGEKFGHFSSNSSFEDPLSMRSRSAPSSSINNPRAMMSGPSTDEAYETFMKEINQLV